ncbi:gastrula zinc finger protein XlCGF66.1-like isoform X1 [Phyllobates terribilis]|uniref:gastrula zinc finger protein XlCGF66.1-like isoform X1 n=2 Tax=Phyllobates terribilis TaxID=111132 RepID=UPI003CCB6616
MTVTSRQVLSRQEVTSAVVARSMIHSINDPPRMEQDRDHMAARILDLTLEIIYWITGEDHTVVKTSSGECVTPRVSGGRSRTPSDITDPPPHSLIHEQKILELTTRITELLSGEVPIRCQDVTVYFSMEEWEYLEGHKDLYKDVMVENRPSITSPDGSSPRNPPERCPSPLYSQDWPEREENVPRDHQESSGGTSSGFEDVSSVSLSDEHGIRDFNAHHNVSLCYDVEDNNIIEAKLITDDEPAVIQCINLSSDIADHWIPSPDQSLIQDQTGNIWKYLKNKSKRTLPEQIVTDAQPFLCSECGKCFAKEIQLKRHRRTHTGETPYSCSQCGKYFSQKSHLVDHLRIHTGEKPFSCLECGKCFNHKKNWLSHQRTHTGEKPHPCTVCDKSFSRRSYLMTHLKIHAGEKPFACSECGKCFSNKSHVLEHLRTHTGEKPYTCSECGKCFAHKSNFERHKRTHFNVQIVL